MPITPFIGVRISWLMLARNSPFERLAHSARSVAAARSRVRLRHRRFELRSNLPLANLPLPPPPPEEAGERDEQTRLKLPGAEPGRTNSKLQDGGAGPYSRLGFALNLEPMACRAEARRNGPHGFAFGSTGSIRLPIR